MVYKIGKENANFEGFKGAAGYADDIWRNMTEEQKKMFKSRKSISGLVSQLEKSGYVETYTAEGINWIEYLK